MRPRYLILPIVLAVVAAASWLALTGRIDQVSRVFGLPALAPTPHEAYARSLRRAGLADTPLARQWFTAAERALAEPTDITLPRREAVWLPASQPRAIGLRSTLRRGQRLVIEAELEAAAPVRIFLDLFEETGDGLDHVASAAADDASLAIEVTRDGRYLLRAQPELLEDARVTLAWRTEPTLRVPVEGAGRPDIQSLFLAPRDGGQRDHHGVDIFARRGTPVVAAADGIVTSVGTNTLGGKVVWVVRPLRGERHYYAHLDEQLVAAGTRVVTGDVVGTVGNTGNARGGPPHLHFGIYGAPGPVDPLPYLEPAAAPPLGTAGMGQLGELARLRRSQRTPAGSTPARTLPSGTLVRIVGGSARMVRVELPDRAESYVTPDSLTPTTQRLRSVRVADPVAVTSRPENGVIIDVIAGPATLDVMGTFGRAIYVRRADGLSGWINPSPR